MYAANNSIAVLEIKLRYISGIAQVKRSGIACQKERAQRCNSEAEGEQEHELDA